MITPFIYDREFALFCYQYRSACAALYSAPRTAQALYQDALQLARQICQLDNEALALEGIGECYLHTADTQSGIAYLKQALDIFQRLAMNPDANRVDTRLTELSAATSPATFGISW